MIDLPEITRARGFRLYGNGGLRLVDLWQNGGAAILGHKPSGVVREIKNTAERGLFSPFPHTARRRFTKALERLFPQMAFKVYADWRDLPDYQKFPLWRPFHSPLCAQGKEKIPAFRPVLPFSLAPAVIVCEKSDEHNYPPSNFPSPFMLTAAARAIYDLLSWPERGIMRFNRVKNALAQPEAQKNWRLDGIYIYSARANAEKCWPDMFRRFLDGGFLLPPEAASPIIMPAELSKGEETTLSCLLQA
ncbi:MAG: hypothetical protein LBB22_05190 [Treponema sp.]|nr:hypothetical protein [Treponema sp.]